jgi:hypothetical protein
MKILNKIWGISLLALLLIAVAPHTSKAQDEYISEQDFYDELAPYGTWVYDSQYGDVWVPDVAEDFSPYRTRGHWVLTEYGNTWVSDYPWGWATFHYGRWRYDDFYGWEWIPGYEWAPAWVSWRHGGGYYGWAPLTPGISISLSFGSSYRVPDSYWAFAPEAYINRPNIYNYYVPHTRVVNIIRNTTVVNNTYVNGDRRYIAGPRAVDIQRYTHQRPRVYAINNASRPGAINVQNNAVNIFRPAVKRGGDARPQRVVDANAYKQQNPNQGIARRGPGGAAGFNHDNASRLANVARNTNDNNNVVRVNNRPNNDQPTRRPGQSRRPDQQGDGRPNGQDSRPNQVQPSQTPPTQTQPAQQPVFNRGGGRNDNDSRPATNQQNNNLQQKQQQINSEKNALREQRRDEYRRERQLQTIPQVIQPPAINGQTPIQQQQMAIRDQQRQLRQQQRQQTDQQNQVRQQQQAQQVQQQAAQKAQQDQQRQAQQQAAQKAQQDQQRQAQQQAEQQQRGQAQQVAQEQQRAQREQQRQQAQQVQQQQAQQAAQQQQRAQQQAAQQAQQQQRAQQQQQQQQRPQRRPLEQVKPTN